MLTMTKILTNPTANSKISKSMKKGFLTYGIHLAPFNLSGFNVCANASAGCASACLNTAGRGRMTNIQKARIAKTKRFFSDKKLFLQQLSKEIKSAIKSADKKQMTACFRLNLTSDLPWEAIKLDGLSLMEMFPDVQFYDYTKSFKRAKKFADGEMPKNYHLTFSRSECNDNLCDILKDLGVNIATVFRNSLPETYKGLPVIDGDETDLRFLDGESKIIGLVEKGLAKKDETGFVIG